MGGGDATFMTPAEVATLLGVSPVTVRAWAARGLCATRVTPGGHRRFARHEVERFARQRGMSLPDTPRPAASRVLVVDADPHSRDFLCDLCRQHGVAVAHAADAFAAGFQLAIFRPDLVVLNAAVPGLDGDEVCRRIKTDPRTCAVRVVIVGEGLNAVRRDEMRAAGVERCFDKPLDLAALGALLPAITAS